MSKFDQTLERTQSWYPKAVKSESHGHIFFVDETDYILIVFKGKLSKAVERLRFKNLIQLNSFLTSFKEKAQKEIQKREKFIEQRKAANEAQIMPGAIYLSSWGYEQTNVSFYQIVAVKGTKVTFKQIAQDKIYSASDCGKTKAIKDEFISDPIDLRSGLYGFKLDSVQTLHHWDGNSVYWSSYH